MKISIVFVKFVQAGISGSRWNVRYVDSQWASEEHARERKKELEDSLERSGMASTDYDVKILLGRVSDAEVEAPKAEGA